MVENVDVNPYRSDFKVHGHSLHWADLEVEESAGKESKVRQMCTDLR